MPARPEFLYMVCPFAAAFVVSALFAPGVIGMLRRRGVGQKISEDGPESHHAKEGTPTMGGLAIIAGILGGLLVYLLLVSREPWACERWGQDRLFAALLLVVAFAVVGMVDDYLTIRPVGGVRGIASRPKAAVQLLLAASVSVWIVNAAPVPLMLGGAPVLMGWAYAAFAALYIVGLANFVNITDGLDGLAAGLVSIACVAFGLTVHWRGADPETFAVTPLIWAAAGACVAFLWFNCNPAKVFMGDTGSLALGALLPVVAVLTHREVMMLVVVAVFVMEGLSVMVQWAVFKFTRITTGTGRRVFRKSPLHHHFELCGWREQQVVARFWIMGIISAVVGVAGSLAGYW